jgi:exodeoxyribonuclease V beta subunit
MSLLQPLSPRQFGPFDIRGPLPRPGVTVLEASAGTGKTHTIAALVTRFIAEGAANIDQVLVVSFTRIAAGELRDRVRARLAAAELGLSRLGRAHGRPALDNDQLVAVLAAGGNEAEARRRRLASALADFDATTITTTHGFCLMALGELGTFGNVGPGAAILEDPSELIEEVVGDLYARYVTKKGGLLFTPRQAFEIGEKAVANPGTPLCPPAATGDCSEAGLRRRLAKATREEAQRRLVDSNLMTYDGLLFRLAVALGDGERGPIACRRLRQRYKVVLVDEFQDTDTLQWEVLRNAFTGEVAGEPSPTTLVLVGDPKQAIYAFRGADIYAYLDAARQAPPESRFTLDQNWRSDADLIRALDTFLSPLHLGHREIEYRKVRPAPGHEGSWLCGAPKSEPLRVRILPRAEPRLQKTSTNSVEKESATKWVARDLAADIVALLSSGARLGRGGPSRAAAYPVGDEGPMKALSPQDIGVLVRTNRQAVTVEEALREAGVPVVVAAAESVLRTPAALEWVRLLEALEQPSSRSTAVAAALGPFFGKRADELASLSEPCWEALHSRLHEWSAVVRQAGPATLFAHACSSERLLERLLREPGGERRFTDLSHIAELLDAEAARSQLGIAALRAWLVRRSRAAASEKPELDEMTRRLDSDAAAVQVLTVHRAKGLEFPVVYLPFTWDYPYLPQKGPVVFHDPADGFQRKLDVGVEAGQGSYAAHAKLSENEGRGEDLRYLYVALTRARHQVTLWWTAAQGSQHSALGRILLRKRPNGDVEPVGYARPPSDGEVCRALEEIAQRAPGLLGIEVVRLPDAVPLWSPAPHEVPKANLRVANFARSLDTVWGRASYTSVAASSHGGHRPPGAGEAASSEPEEPGRADEPLAVLVPSDAGQKEAEGYEGWPSPWREVPSGAEIGSFVHGVLEGLDFAAADLQEAVSAAVNARAAAYPGDLEAVSKLCDPLVAALTTPLGPAVGGTRLADIRWLDRLAEVRFELPVAGGDSPTGSISTRDLAALFARHLGPGPLAGYGAELCQPGLATELRGYLTGSIDLVFRQVRPHGEVYFVVDYKTNWLAPAGEELSTWHYRPQAMEAEMRRSHYPLQALFYLVALHRYLRWRLPGYDPARHLGGAIYLFLRGMAGPDAPHALDDEPYGVFSWRPPAELVTEASDILAGGRASGAGAPRPTRGTSGDH